MRRVCEEVLEEPKVLTSILRKRAEGMKVLSQIYAAGGNANKKLEKDQMKSLKQVNNSYHVIMKFKSNFNVLSINQQQQIGCFRDLCCDQLQNGGYWRYSCGGGFVSF